MTKKKNSSKKSASKATKPAAKPLKKDIAKKKVIKTSPKPMPVSKKASQPALQKSSKKEVTVKSSKKLPAKKATKVVTQKAPATVKTAIQKKKVPAISLQMKSRGALQQTFVTRPIKQSNRKLDPFLTKQKQRLLQLKDMLLDSMSGVAKGNLRSGCDASAFGMHQADAGSDAYDRDFSLSILSQEQNSLYEIDEALKRIDDGTYGICEISNKPILHARLEARPFTRYTVECQADLEKRQHVSGTRLPVSALFGITEEESENEEEEGFSDHSKD